MKNTIITYVLLALVIAAASYSIVQNISNNRQLTALNQTIDSLRNSLTDLKSHTDFNAENTDYENNRRFKRIEDILAEVEEVALQPARTILMIEDLVDDFFEFYEVKKHFDYLKSDNKGKTEEEILTIARQKKEYRDVIMIDRYRTLKSILKSNGIYDPDSFIEQFGKIPYNIKYKYPIFEKFYRNYTR